jgi:hypothetical protein
MLLSVENFNVEVTFYETMMFVHKHSFSLLKPFEFFDKVLGPKLCCQVNL